MLSLGTFSWPPERALMELVQKSVPPDTIYRLGTHCRIGRQQPDMIHEITLGHWFDNSTDKIVWFTALRSPVLRA